jgi:hypothetical protein
MSLIVVCFRVVPSPISTAGAPELKNAVAVDWMLFITSVALSAVMGPFPAKAENTEGASLMKALELTNWF